MSEYSFTAHARDMLKERNILEQWVLQTINDPNKQETGPDGNRHYFRFLPERDNRVLHVVVNEKVEPHRVVTLFLDRRERKTE